MRVITFVFLLCLSGSAWANPTIDLNVIATIESSNNPNAVSFAGAHNGRGLYQISEIALKDYLIYHKEQITPEDLFNPAINRKVSTWLFTKRIPQLLKHFDRPVTLENILAGYNCGYRSGCFDGSIKETKDYIIKYINLTGGKL